MILAGDIGGTKTALGTYSPEAGNMALKVMVTGGVYLGGGILPRILPAHKKGHFIENFLRKGRMSRLLLHMPVNVILFAKTALTGAAYYGLEMF